MINTPGWIQVLYRRRTAANALRSAFLGDFERSLIAETAAAHELGEEDLRRFALSELQNAEPSVVALSLVFLSVVGELHDLAAISEFTSHPSELVQRAARACQYELGRRA